MNNYNPYMSLWSSMECMELILKPKIIINKTINVTNQSLKPRGIYLRHFSDEKKTTNIFLQI